MDWTEMLERMYLRWCQVQGYSTRILDRNTGADIQALTAAKRLLLPSAGLLHLIPWQEHNHRHSHFKGYAMNAVEKGSAIFVASPQELRLVRNPGKLIVVTKTIAEENVDVINPVLHSGL